MPLSRTLTLALLLSLSGYAQTKPNFTGTWKLNVGKSDFGPLPAPDSRTDVIAHNGDTIKDDVTSEGQQGKLSYTINMKTDGSESLVHAGPRDVKFSAKWDGPELAVTQKLNFDGNDVVGNSKWSLSSDGNILTFNIHFTSPMGEADQKYVFEKQAGGAATSATAKPATSGGKPNFSGVWKLNVEKSDFGPLPAPESETDTIEHSDPNLKLAVAQVGAQGKQNYELNIAINGQEQTHKMGPREVKTTANWEGTALVVLTKLMFQDMEVLVKNTYTIAADGKTVNVNSHLSSSMGEADQKMVYEKQ